MGIVKCFCKLTSVTLPCHTDNFLIFIGKATNCFISESPKRYSTTLSLFPNVSQDIFYHVYFFKKLVFFKREHSPESELPSLCRNNRVDWFPPFCSGCSWHPLHLTHRISVHYYVPLRTATPLGTAATKNNMTFPSLLVQHILSSEEN